MMAKTENQISLTAQESTELKERLSSNQLNQQDIATLVSILNVFISLRQLVEKRKLGLLKLLRQIFGFKTEKSDQKSRKRITSESNNKSGGRKGRDDYPGAVKSHIKHESLSVNDKCPECITGKLSDAEEGVDYEWEGNSPLVLKIFLLERLICSSCKSTFTASSPVRKTVDDSDCEEAEKTGRCDKNAKANATLANLRFQYGVPHYRLAKIQNQMGMGLPVATQYKMLLQVYFALLPIYKYLLYLAAQGYLLKADDTGIKILDWLAGKGPPTKTHDTPRKKAVTSAIISRIENDKTIVLYLTGGQEAGKNIQFLLKKRDPKKGPPLYMCDALASNSPGKDAKVIQLYCLVHARRGFIDIRNSFPEHCDHVINELKLIWKADKEAKIQEMSPAKRLQHHQENSRPVMERLGRWLQENLESGKIEQNNDLGRAANYMLKRWSEFNEFHHIEGVPLCNSETERTIKSIITHRKNSLFYKTTKGAEVGSVIQSLISTCERDNKNPIEYLSWVQENKSAVKKNPEYFLPWNFQSSN